jgi:hypothetical protein
VSKIMYKAHSYKAEIVAAEIVAETAKFVTTREPHHWKDGAFVESKRAKAGYFDTWEACKADMIARGRREVEGCKNALHHARTNLGMVEAMKQPAPVTP